MRKILRNISLASVLLFSSLSARAQEGSSSDGFWMADAKVGVNLFSSFRASGGLSSSSVFGFYTGAAGSYFFNDNVGLFVGLDYVTRGVELVSGDTLRSGFLEIPFGVTFRYDPWAGKARATTKLGGFYSIGLGDLEDGGTVYAEKASSFGIVVSSATFFAIGENFALGPDVTVKFGLTPGYKKNGALGLKNFFDLGIGLAGSYIF